MAKTFSEIDDTLRNFVERQHLFFVATAPSSVDGHVNCSPKGLDSLRILGPTTVAYLDYSGSGAETIAHVRENGRIVIMLCAFEGAPKIVRFHGKGEVIEAQDAEFASLVKHFEPEFGPRSIIRVELDRISDSCGFGVPLLDFQGERTQLATWAAKKGPAGMEAYRRQKNAVSIDGLPALSFADSET
jgi:Pyridoxamine 5'-phosphate oxidase